jgi:AcrR family transcriptional regulator
MARINNHQDAKKKIIAAAIEIATETGWNAVTLEAISKKIGVTKAVLPKVYWNRCDSIF